MPHSGHVMALQLYRQGRFRNGGFNMPYTAGPLVRRAVTTIARRLASGAVKRRRMDVSRQSAAQSGSSSAPLTGNFDYKTDYRKRRLTRYRRRRVRRQRKWTRRVVKAVRENTLGSAHILRRSYAADLLAGENMSNSASYMMYSLTGNTNLNVDPNNDVAQVLYEGAPTDWNNWESTSLTSVNHKLHAYHGTMEVNIVNTSGADAWVEVYFIRARRRGEAAWISPNYVYNQGFKRQKPTIEPDTGAFVGAELVPTELGVTPFQNSLFCSMFNIYKRQKFRVPAGGEVSFTMHDPRPRTYTIAGVKPYAWDRGTSGVLIQWQGVARGGEFPVASAASALSFNVVRRYRYKFSRDDTPTDGRL